MPDAVGLALDEWWRDKQGVQQELLSAPNGTPNAQSIATPVTAIPAVSPASAESQQQLSLGSYDAGQSFIGTCPDCGSQLEFAEGCVKCHVCGFSECG